MMTHKCIVTFALSALLPLLCFSASGQNDYAKKFSKLRVSEEVRARLVERFTRFVEYEISQKFEEQFDLHPPGDQLYHLEGPTRESYASLKRELADRDGHLFELKVQSIDSKLRKDGSFFISVSVKLKKGDKLYKSGSDSGISPIMRANLKDGEWYFSLDYFRV